MTALRAKRRNLTLEIAHAGFAGVAANDLDQRVSLNLKLLLVQAMVFHDLGNEMPLGDFDLLILGVAGDADQLHAIHERRRNIQRVRRGHEHHVRQVVFDLEIVVHERRILFGIENLEQCR